MPLPAIPAAKAAAAILTDEKARTAMLSVITGVLAALLLPIVMLISIVTIHGIVCC